MTQSITEKIGSWMKFWPLILAGFVLMAGGLETRYQVQQLVANKQTDQRQWARIADHGNRLTAFEEWRKEVEKVITPDSMQEWGRFKADVARHERAIERLEGR